MEGVRGSLWIKQFYGVDSVEDTALAVAEAKVNSFLDEHAVVRENIIECNTKIEKGGIAYRCTIVLTFWENTESSGQEVIEDKEV